MIVIQIFIVAISAAVLCVAIYSVYRGASYIGAANFLWAKGSLDRAFNRHPVAKTVFRVTPIALMILFGWGGYCILNNFLWFMGDTGFVDRESHEWKTYRSAIAMSLGAGLGVGFGFWLVSICEKILMTDKFLENMTAEEQIRYIVFREAKKD